jgi:hypothetical protein
LTAKERVGFSVENASESERLGLTGACFMGRYFVADEVSITINLEARRWTGGMLKDLEPHT